jgi:Holliday junction DNA helicase RuvA
MIGKLRGIIDEKDDESVILDVGGVGYHIFVSSRLLALLNVGENTVLHIEMNVREDHIHLYGFPNALEREWFRVLTTVQRLGNKMALAILGAYSPPQLVNAILAKDTAAFSRISGIGAKLAERIVIELKDKVLKMPTGDFSVTNMEIAPPSANKKTSKNQPQINNPEIENKIIEDAISALVNLGYNRSDAYLAVNKSAKNADKKTNLGELIKISLKELM